MIMKVIIINYRKMKQNKLLFLLSTASLKAWHSFEKVKGDTRGMTTISLNFMLLIILFMSD